jgi:hypothetical protein
MYLLCSGYLAMEVTRKTGDLVHVTGEKSSSPDIKLFLQVRRNDFGKTIA